MSICPIYNTSCILPKMADAPLGSDSLVVTAAEETLLLSGGEDLPVPPSTRAQLARYQRWLMDEARRKVAEEALNVPLPPGDGVGDDLDNPEKGDEVQEEDMSVDPTEEPTKVAPVTDEGTGARPKSPQGPRTPLRPDTPVGGGGTPPVHASPTPGKEVEKVPEESPPAIGSGGWKLVETRKALRKRAKVAKEEWRLQEGIRPVTVLADLLVNGRHKPPPRNDSLTGISDDEDWMEDVGHPIDYYVDEIENLIDSSNKAPLVSAELRMKLTYSWKYYVPGDPCPFIRCQVRSGRRKPVAPTNRPRFARHLLENHCPSVMVIYCVSAGATDACPAWSDGDLHRTNRRGCVVRHLMKNGGHQYGLPKARRLTCAVWKAAAGVKCPGKLRKQFVPNTMTRRFRLTDHDWLRCIGKDLNMGEQADTGDARSDVQPK